VKSATLLTLALLVLFSGCTSKIKDSSPEPNDLIPKEQMVDIFVDLKIMDAILASKQRKKETDLHFTKIYYHNSIMEKYGITRDRFVRSFEYYERDLEVLDEIYEEAITKLSKMKSEEDKAN
jgi:hypothetical protein